MVSDFNASAFITLCKVQPNQKNTHVFRTQFIDPCQNKEESPTKRKPSDSTAAIDGFYEDIEAPRVGGLDPDHALLLKSVAPLLLSQNSGVVLSTATLIFHTSPDASSIAKPLVRLLRSHRETQYIVLTNISVMADSKPGIFSSYLSSFYVRAGDPKMVRDLKLDIASAVVTPSTLDALLKELFSYSQSPDEDLARTSIRAMAKCIACSPKATARCLSALLNLLNDKNHMVVGEAITAIKQLLQSFFSEDTTSSVLARLVHLFHKDYETLPSVAKAAILWLVGQYSSLLVQYAPDIFRVAVRDFAEAEEEFKMQTLTLGIKLMAQFPDNRVSPFFSHLMALARYDRNFHVRDRARLIQGSYTLSQGDGFLRNHLQGLFCDSKPAPTLNSLAQDRKRFSLGSASLQLNHQVRGYQPLPEWPLEQPDGSARNKGESLSQYTGPMANETRAIHSGHPPGPSPHTVSKPAQFEDLDAFYGDDSSQQSQNTTSGDSEVETEDSQPDSEFTDSESESYSETDSSDQSISDEKGSLLKGTQNT
ncbi:AP-3 complex subunit beta, variant 2 [Entomophthora muscae]|uniref:AP-3 complex subunit beta, variant 2 n=1 Tax=Entomophthora muscae TaxID=34485 RepID=A0ACC2UKZ9_9FUNG|nr:AP-3 complex subunit beta, variant 2 [Entomophthora muscae]